MSMRKIREVLRLTHELGLSVREVREATGVGKTAVSEYVSYTYAEARWSETLPNWIGAHVNGAGEN